MEAVDEARLRGVDQSRCELLQIGGSVFATPRRRADRVLGGVDGLAGSASGTRAVKFVAYCDDRIEPSTATPNAPPTCRVVSLTAEPTPALARGSDPMIESVAGAMTLPMPRPSAHVTRMTWRVDESGWSVRNDRKPTPTINSPVATTRLLPKRCTQMLLSGAATMIVTACGSRTAPALTVEYSSTDCRYCVIRNSVPNNEKNAIVIAPLAALNRGFWKKWMLSIGLDVCSSHNRNVTSSPAPIAKPASTSGAVQPCDGASITAHRNVVSPAMDSSAPRGSSRGEDGSLRFRNEQIAEDQAEDHDRHVDEEHRAPPEVGEQYAATDRADADAECGHAGPDPDGTAALARFGEHVGEHRQRRRHDERAADAHERTRRDQHVGIRRERREQRSDAEHGQAERERLVASESVTEAARREQESREHDRVRVDDPLELTASRGQTTALHRMRERRQRDVEDRVVEHDHDEAHAQHEQREPAALVHVLRVLQPCAHSPPPKPETEPSRIYRSRCETTTSDRQRSPAMADEELVFERAQWATLRASTPLELDDDDLAELRGINERLDLDEVAEIYLPLSRLLSLFAIATRDRDSVTDTFLGVLPAPRPYIIGLAGSVAVGKSTTARILQELLARWPAHPRVELVTTDGFLYPNRELAARGLTERKGFPESYDTAALVAFLSALKRGEPEVERAGVLARSLRHHRWRRAGSAQSRCRDRRRPQRVADHTRRVTSRFRLLRLHHLRRCPGARHRTMVPRPVLHAARHSVRRSRVVLPRVRIDGRATSRNVRRAWCGPPSTA